MLPAWRRCSPLLGVALRRQGAQGVQRSRAAALGQLPVAFSACSSHLLGYERGFCSGTAVSAALVKELRERTGASMGKCRDALREANGDLDQAVDWLRRRGIKSMERRTAEAGEALLAVGVGPNGGAIVELRAETDFVTRGEIFQQLGVCLAQTAAQRGVSSATELLEAPLEGTVRPKQVAEGTSVSSALLEVGSVVGERLVVADAQHLTAPPGGFVTGYVHPKQADGQSGIGRMAALVALRPTPSAGYDQEKVQATALQLARHVVAMQPRFVSVESVPADVLQKERDTLKAAHLDQLNSKKAVDDAILAKVLDGKIQKFYQEMVLLNQEFIAPQAVEGGEPKLVSVAEWLKAEAAALGLESLSVEGIRVAKL